MQSNICLNWRLARVSLITPQRALRGPRPRPHNLKIRRKFKNLKINEFLNRKIFEIFPPNFYILVPRPRPQNLKIQREFKIFKIREFLNFSKFLYFQQNFQILSPPPPLSEFNKSAEI